MGIYTDIDIPVGSFIFYHYCHHVFVTFEEFLKMGEGCTVGSMLVKRLVIRNISEIRKIRKRLYKSVIIELQYHSVTSH